MALIQLIIYMVVFLVSLNIMPTNGITESIAKMFSGLNTNFVIITVLIMLFGIMMYLRLATIIVALINDQSQVQQAVQPVSFLAMIGYCVAIYG